MVFAKSPPNQLISASEKHHSPVWYIRTWSGYVIDEIFVLCLSLFFHCSSPINSLTCHLKLLIIKSIDQRRHLDNMPTPIITCGHQLSHHNSVQHSDTEVSLMQCDYNISKLALTLPLNYLFLDEQERFLQRTAYRRGSPTTRSSCAQPFFMST